MKTFNRLELLVIKSALLIDEYSYTYFPSDYKNKVGTMEIHRIRNINNLIHTIADNSTEFTCIIKDIAEDIDYLEHEIKGSGPREYISQLYDARKILNLLNEIA